MIAVKFIGSQIEFSISDPWELVSENIGKFTGTIVETMSTEHAKPDRVRIKLDRKVNFDNLIAYEVVAQSRYEGTSVYNLEAGGVWVCNLASIDPSDPLISDVEKKLSQAKIHFSAGLKLRAR